MWIASSERIAGPGLADRDGLACADPGASRQPTGGGGFGVEQVPGRRDLGRLQREAGGQTVADPEDRVHGPVRRDAADRLIRPRGELPPHQFAHRRGRDRQLTGVHLHDA
jgi:hypothetical protein